MDPLPLKPNFELLTFATEAQDTEILELTEATTEPEIMETLQITCGAFSVPVLEQQYDSVKHNQMALTNNGNSRIIEDLISFQNSNLVGIYHNLIMLNLGFNNLHSLERLCGLRMPNLKNLHLFQNQIHSCRGLHRATFPALTYINLVENKIISLGALSIAHFPHLQQIWAYDNLILEGYEELKMQNALVAGSLGDPDLQPSLQIMLYARNHSYYPLQINLNI